MKYQSIWAHLACALGMAVASSAFGADFQQGLRLKANNQLEAAATEFAAVIKETPGDSKAWEQYAVVTGWLGKHDASIAAWQRVLELEPQRDDARIAIGRVRYWKGDYPGALAALDDALVRQPQSAESQTLRGDVLLASGKYQAARDAFVAAQTNGADKADIARKLAAAVPPKQWRLDTGYTQDSYSNERGGEHTGFVQVGYTIAPTLSVYARVDAAKQFGTNDGTTYLGGYWRALPDLLVSAEVGGTQNASFRPTSQAQIGFEFLHFKSVQPLLGLKTATYGESKGGVVGAGKGTVNSVTPGLRVVFPGAADVELRYTLSDNIDSSKTQVTQLRVNIDAGERFSPYVAFYSGTESLPPLPFASLKVLVVGAVYKIDANWSVRADLSHEDRQDFYRRDSIGFGLSYFF
jgi:YaiO family outer membrane protein